MNRIIIGQSEHVFCDVKESWIQHHVEERRHHGQAVGAMVILKTQTVDLRLQTPNWPSGPGGGGRLPNEKETEIFKIWAEEQLNAPHWKASHLYAFVKRVRHLVCH